MVLKLVVAGQAVLAANAPNPAPSAPPGMEVVATSFLSWGKWILLVAGVLGFFICAGMMIIGRRNRSQTAVDGAAGVPWVLAGLALTSLAAGIAGVALT
ncbi:hypothetical protein HCB17_05440 [Salinispora arenicola]|uniref:hypothetical protein n=1 Tax=Salinispora arenicola TaxID=168697 RepID=UPI0014315FEA|nr:hypothetical protein [Salinispora arenicola]NIL40676.1 hypothetical protein [Salinispora arenicola]